MSCCKIEEIDLIVIHCSDGEQNIKRLDMILKIKKIVLQTTFRYSIQVHEKLKACREDKTKRNHRCSHTAHYRLTSIHTPPYSTQLVLHKTLVTARWQQLILLCVKHLEPLQNTSSPQENPSDTTIKRTANEQPLDPGLRNPVHKYNANKKSVGGRDFLLHPKVENQRKRKKQRSKHQKRPAAEKVRKKIVPIIQCNQIAAHN